MEANAVTVPKLEANRHRSSQHKETVSTYESPSDVGRLNVPIEDLDRVDGIRPSSSRTRAVALLPAIEESAEEGPESLHLETPGAQSVHWGRRTSSRPMLMSISEERIPRLWEYPLGGRSWERARSPGRALGAGEAPPIQSQREQSSPGAFDKTSDGDIGLAEAGDAEKREGNRSNHALGDSDSSQEEKQEMAKEQNVPHIAFSATESSERGAEARPENVGGAFALGNIIPSHSSFLESSSHNLKAVYELGDSYEASPLKLADENCANQFEQDLKEVNQCVNLSVTMEETNEMISLEEEVGAGNQSVNSFKVYSDTESLEESHLDSYDGIRNPLQKSMNEGEEHSKFLLFMNRDEKGVLCDSYEGGNFLKSDCERPFDLAKENQSLKGVYDFVSDEELCSFKEPTGTSKTDFQTAVLSDDVEIDRSVLETSANIDKTDGKMKTCIQSEHVRSVMVEENSTLSILDGLDNETFEIGKERKYIGSNSVLNSGEGFERVKTTEIRRHDNEDETNTIQSHGEQGVDLAQFIEENIDTIPHLKECINENTMNRSHDFRIDQIGAVPLDGENHDSQEMTPMGQSSNEKKSDEMFNQLNSSRYITEPKGSNTNMVKSEIEVSTIMSGETCKDRVNTNEIKNGQFEVLYGGHHQGAHGYKEDSSSNVEVFTYNANSDEDHDGYGIGNPHEHRISSSHIIVSECCAKGSLDIVATEATVNGISSQEDSIVSSSGSTRAKGSGSDSMVADGTVSAVEATAARESHSDHTSCSDKVDQTAKAKDGSAKPRGRERERAKRKRADREEREDRGGSPGGKQKSLKNAVGDVQAEAEDAGEAAAEDMLQVKVKNSPAHDLVVKECRTIRATSSGDVRDAAVKSTCGLESQTVTSLDDQQSEMLESTSLWEQEQILEDPDNSGRCHSSPKGIPASRFGKRTQLHRQKQGSPQEEALKFPDTEKSSAQVLALGLGDSELCTSSKTVTAEFSPADNAAWTFQGGRSNCVQDESCNNPMDPNSSMDNSDSHLQFNIGAHVDNTPLAYSEIQAMSRSEEHVLRNYEHQVVEQVEQGPNQRSASILIQTQTNATSGSENRDVFYFHDSNSCEEFRERCMHLDVQSPSEVDSIRIENGNVLDPQCNTTESTMSDEYEIDIKIINESETGSLNKIRNVLKGASSENQKFSLDFKNIFYDFAENKTECGFDNGALCCSQAGPPDRPSTMTSTVATSSDDLSDPQSDNSSSPRSGVSTKTGASSKSGKSSVCGTKKPSSNFDSFFLPMCLSCSKGPKLDLKETVTAALPSISQSSPARKKYTQIIRSQDDKVQEITDFCKTEETSESMAQISCLSEDLHSSYDRHVLSAPDSRDGRIDSDLDRRLVIDKSTDNHLHEVMNERDSADRSIELQLSREPYTLDKDRKKSSQGELVSSQSEGLHIPYTCSDGYDFEKALVSALAEAAQDDSPLASRKNPTPEDVSATSIGNMEEILKISLSEHSYIDQIGHGSLNMAPKRFEKIHDEYSPPMQPTQTILNEKTFTPPNPPVVFQNGLDNFDQEKEENSHGCISEANSLKNIGDILKLSRESDVESNVPVTTYHGDRDESQIREIKQSCCEKVEYLFNISQDSNLAVSGRETILDNENIVQEESHENALCETASNPMCRDEKVETQAQVFNQEIGFDKGDFPALDKVPDNFDLRKEYDDISHEFLEGQENRRIVDYNVVVVHNTTPFTSPFPQRRPHTPVAGDGDCIEKVDSDTKVKQEQGDCIEVSETEKSKNIQFSENIDQNKKTKDTKSNILKQEMIAEGGFFLTDEINSIFTSVDDEKQNSESISHSVKDTVEGAKVSGPLLEQNGVHVNTASGKRDEESKKISEISLHISSEKNHLNTLNRPEDFEKSSLTSVDLGEQMSEIDVEQTNMNDDVGYTHEANQEMRVTEKSSEEDNSHFTEKDDIWADAVIREVNKVCENYQQKQQMEHANEQSAIRSLSAHKGDHPSPEELEIEPAMRLSYNQLEYKKRSARKKSIEHNVEVMGRSKDGGKRAKRSKQYGNQENQMNEGQPFVSDAQVKRITVVDVALFPQDTPCVYHPDRADIVKKQEKCITHSAVAQNGGHGTRGKRLTLWRRLKTIFRPKRRMSKERSVKTGRGSGRDEHLARQASTVSSLPAPIIHLGQPVKSEDTLGLPQGSSEAWTGPTHKVKFRPAGQWRRLKKFRVLRRGAERQGGRLPPSLRQVVSKSNYIRAAEGDHPSSGGYGVDRISRGKKKSSSDLPGLNQSHLMEQKEVVSRSTPEVPGVFGDDEILSEGYFSPDQPALRLVLKPVPVMPLAGDSNGSPTLHPTGGKEFRQRIQSSQEDISLKEEELKSRLAVRNRDTGETGKGLELGKERSKANTYHGNSQRRTSTSRSKDKASTYQCMKKNRPLEGSRANKNCLLM